MIHHARIAGTVLLAAALTRAIFGGTAHAADSTRYISITGNNASPCTLAKPCRSLQRAIRVTPAGGEIRVLDSGFFGNNATIRKSLTLSGNGHTVFLGSPIVVDKADVVVALRGLVLNGGGASGDGIKIVAAAAVHIERCVIHGFVGNGISALADGVEVFVGDSIVRSNNSNGISTLNAGLTIDNSRFEDNAFTGVLVQSGRATISRSITSGNGNSGIATVGAPVGVVTTMAVGNGTIGFFAAPGGTLTVESSAAHDNGVEGLLVFNGGVARISNSTFIGNATGVRNNGGTVETRQNNTVRGNTTNVTGSLTPIGGV